MRKVLIVDDELCKPANAETFCKEYSIEGIEYLFAGSGDEMIRALQEEDSISSIFLDIRFEGIAPDYGLSLLERIINQGWPIPVIMMSSLSDPATIIKSWDLGAQGYILKWSSNPRFFEEFKEKANRYANLASPSSIDLVERKRNRIKIRTQNVLKEHGQISLEDLIAQALEFKESIGGDWVNKLPLPPGFQNYVCGWNETDAILQGAERDRGLLYLNIDFGTGCTLHCPHCFTQEGAVDSRGRTPLPYEVLKEAILDARQLGLRCVRILGRGEPLQWVHNPNRGGSDQSPACGEDIIDFIKFLHDNGIIPLVFTRGQIAGDDTMVKRFYDGAHGINNGTDLTRWLRRQEVSLFLGVSSIFPEINNEMVGIPKTDRFDYDRACRRSLRLAIEAGFNRDYPTRLAVEMPITNLNIMEMGVRYILFQMLNISPCTNVYMVTGRALTYGLGEITDPPQDRFVDNYAMVARFAQNMGIDVRVGSYAGTKECHDVSCGMYLTLNGDLYPCPGYEGIHNLVGSLRTHSLRKIWENNPYGGHPQSICPPKIGTHFPPDFADIIDNQIKLNKFRYDELFSRIVQGLEVDYESQKQA